MTWLKLLEKEDILELIVYSSFVTTKLEDMELKFQIEFFKIFMMSKLHPVYSIVIVNVTRVPMIIQGA